MGIGFVIFIHLIAIFILSIVIALVASIITFFISNQEKRKHKILIAALSPFIGLYTLYFAALFGSVVVSEIKNIDVGIGDTWYIPVGSNCQLMFVDLPEQAYLNHEGQTVIADISHIQQIENMIFGNTYNGQFFSYNLKTNQLTQFASKKEFDIQNTGIKIELIKAIDFYTYKRNDIAGYSLIAVGIISLAISLTVLYSLRILILGYLNFR